MSVLISEIDLKAKNITRDGTEYPILIKRLVHKGEITILNVCEPKKIFKNIQKLKELKGEIHESTITVKIFNIFNSLIKLTDGK